MKHWKATVAWFALLLWSPALWAAGQSLDTAPELGAGAIARLLLGLLAVVGLIVALSWVLRRMGRFQLGQGGQMRVLGALAVGTRERAVLVQVGEEQLLLGVASGQVRLLHVLKEPLEVGNAAMAGNGGAFASRLASALRQGVRR